MLGLDFLREKIQFFSLGEIIKRAVKHPTDVVLAVIDNPPCLPVPENGNGHALVVLWIGHSVGFAQKLEAVDRVSGGKRRAGRNLAGRIAKGPAVLISNRIDYRHADRLFQSFQLPNNNGATSPRAGQRNVEMIAARLGSVGRRAII